MLVKSKASKSILLSRYLHHIQMLMWDKLHACQMGCLLNALQKHSIKTFWFECVWLEMKIQIFKEYNSNQDNMWKENTFTQSATFAFQEPLISHSLFTNNAGDSLENQISVFSQTVGVCSHQIGLRSKFFNGIVFPVDAVLSLNLKKSDCFHDSMNFYSQVHTIDHCLHIWMTEYEKMTWKSAIPKIINI